VFGSFAPVRAGLEAGHGLVAVDDAGGSWGAARLLTLHAGGALAASEAISPPEGRLKDFLAVGGRAGAVAAVYDTIWGPPGPRGHFYVTLRAGGRSFGAPQLIAPPHTDVGAEARLALDSRSPRATVVWDAGRITGDVGSGGRIEWAANY
jgi:hypothetical protein